MKKVHFYSDKTPTFSLILAAFYFILFHLGLAIQNYTFITVSLLTVLGVVLPAVLRLYLFPMVAALLLPQSREEHIQSARNLLAFGTIMVSFSGLLNYHLMATFFLMSSVYLLLSKSETEIKTFRVEIAGFFLGLLCAIDIPTGGIFILTFALFLALTIQYKALLWLMIGAFLPIAAYESINYSITCKLLPPFFYRLEFYQFAGSTHTANSLTGEPGTGNLFAMKHVYQSYRNFFGGLGLFSLSPILVLAVIGHLRMVSITRLRSGFLSYRRVEYFLAIATILQICFYNCFVPSAVGKSYGVRHLIPVIPLIMLGYVSFLESFHLKNLRLVVCASILFAFGGAFQYKQDDKYLWGWRQLIPAYSFVDSIGLLKRYGQ